MTHGRDCLLHYFRLAVPVREARDLPPEIREAIGYTEPYVPPAGVPPLPANGSYGENGLFTVDAGRLALRITGKPPKPLCPFDGWITEELKVLHDDGRPDEFLYVIEGLAQTAAGPVPLPEIRVPSKDFDEGGWTYLWGYNGFVYPGRSSKTSLAHAVRDRYVPQKTTEYTSPGWHEVNGTWRFLTGRSAVGDPTVRVNIPGGFGEKFSLPTVPEHALAGVRETLWALRNLAPLRVMAPVIGCVFRAPLCHWRSAPVTLYIVGTTGIGKSTLAAVAASFYGDFKDPNALFGFQSSANALEDMLFAMKDHLIPMDDVVADASGDRGVLAEKIARIIRSQGNVSSRRRLTANADQKPAKPPRGLPFVTGEVAPTIPSLVARCILIELDETALNLKAAGDKPIDRVQKNGPLLRHATAGYVEWLAARVARGENLAAAIDATAASLRGNIREMEEAEGDETQHARIPANITHAGVGLSFFLDYAVDLGAIARAEADLLLEESLDALVSIARETHEEAGSQATALHVMHQLQQLIFEGKVRLIPRGEAPSGEGIPVVGWADERHLYFQRAGLGLVFKAAREAGNPILLSEDRVMRELAAKGLLDREDDRHLQKNVRVIRGTTTKVYAVKRAGLAELMGNAFYLAFEHHGQAMPDESKTRW